MESPPYGGYIMGTMPWWFWIVLWSLLVLSSLLLLAYFRWRVFRQALGSLDAFTQWGDGISTRLDEAAMQPSTVQKPFEPAIFKPVSVAMNEYVEGKNKRTLDRAGRRIRRRDELGQPQLIGDLLSSSQKGD